MLLLSETHRKVNLKLKLAMQTCRTHLKKIILILNARLPPRSHQNRNNHTIYTATNYSKKVFPCRNCYHSKPHRYEEAPPPLPQRNCLRSVLKMIFISSEKAYSEMFAVPLAISEGVKLVTQDWL